MQGRSCRSPLTIPIHWDPPQVGWVKFNSDNMAQGAPSRAEAGGHFSRSQGDCD